MTVLGYCRVSTEEQATNGVSLDDQRAKIAAYCNLHGLELAEILTDEGRSGKDADRPALRRAMQLSAKRSVSALIVTRLDRLSRNVLDALIIVRELKKNRTRFVSVMDSIDTTTPVGRLSMTMLFAYGEFEREMIVQRTSEAIRFCLKNGRKAGSVAPYGYSVVGRNLIEDTEEQQVLRLIREMSEAGRTVREIAAELQGKGVTLRGKPFVFQKVHRILKRKW